MKKLDLDPKNFDPRTVMGMISRAKDKLMTPRQFSADAVGDYFREKVADVYRDYEKAMKKACALDFDDIIMKTVLLLQNNPEVLEYYQRQFRYVLVDEYQDTNYAQYVLTSCWQVIMRTSAWSVMTTRVSTNSVVLQSKIFFLLKIHLRTQR